MKNIILGLAALASIFIISCNSDSTQQDLKSAKESVTVNKASDEKPCCSDSDKSDGSSKNTAKAATTNTKDHLEVFAFHGTRQCETCKHMKEHTRETLDKYFSTQLKSGNIVYSVIDVDDAANEKLAEKFQATGTALMINNVVNGKDNITDWSDFAFEKANDEGKFIPELKSMIHEALKKQNGNTSSIN